MLEALSELPCQKLISKFHISCHIQLSMSTAEQNFRQMLLTNSQKSQELYSLEQFISQIQRLTAISILFYCPHSKDSLVEFYYKICDEMKLSLMNLRSIRSFIEALRNQNRKIIKNQLKYYQEQFSKKMGENLLIISKKEFKRILDRALSKFINDRLDYQIITDIMIEKSHKSEFISCVKILEMLKEISNQIDQYTQPSLSPEKLINDRRISTQPQASQPQWIIDQLTIALISDPKVRLCNYFAFWHKKIMLFTEFITDIQIREQAESLSQSLKRQQNDLLEDIRFICNQYEAAQVRCGQFQQTLRRINQQKQLYEQVVTEQKNQIHQLKTKITQVQKQKKQFQQQALSMERQIQLGSAELTKLESLHLQIEEELRNQKERYNQLYNQYEKVTKQFNVQSQIVKKQRIFQQRSLKQKLDDTLHRFNRLLKQRQNQKKIYDKKQQEHTLKIQILQAKIEELQNEMRNKKTDLRSFLANSKLTLLRNSIINKSQILEGNETLLLGVRSSLINSAIKKSKLKTQELPSFQVNLPGRISARISQENFNKATSKSNLQKINIAAQNLPQIQQENLNVIDSSLLPAEQELTKVIESDNSSIALQDTNKGFQKKKTIAKAEQASTVISKPEEPSTPQHFLAKGLLINIHGAKYQVTLLFTHKRFCYFDMKLRLVRYLPFQNIKNIVFCRENCTLFIIRPKNISQLDGKKHIVNPLIFSIRSRQKFANYLTTKINRLIKENKIELSTKLEDDIFLRVDDQQINMKHKIANMNNPYRLALSDQPVFYVRLQEQGLLAFKDNAIIVIQPIGLICFKGEYGYELEGKQEFLYFLPFNNCIISERQKSKEAPGRKIKLIYQNQFQRYFNLIFSSREDLKQFVKQCEQQKLKNKNNKAYIYQNLDVRFKK